MNRASISVSETSLTETKVPATHVKFCSLFQWGAVNLGEMVEVEARGL